MNKAFYLVVALFVVGTANCDSDQFAHRKLQPIGVSPKLEVVPRFGQENERLGYALGYDREKRQPRWVAYRLKKEDLTHEFPRNDSFKRDDAVSNSPGTYDYSGTGFERGHMAPANEMEYAFRIMEDSFYMSNMCPQYGHINSGVWKSIENFVRNAAKRFDVVYVISGPIFADEGGPFGSIPMKNEKKKIETSNGDIAVPESFFKVIYTPARGGMMLAFQVDNDEGLLGNYLMYARSVRRIEQITGFRFFADVDPDDDDGLRNMDQVTQWF